MGAHDLELVVGQFGRLVQDVQRDCRLAQVVQQAGQTGLAAGDIVQLHLAAQRHHQRTHRHRVHVGVVVLGLQPHQADQRVRVAEHRLRDVVDQRQAALGVQRAAHAGLAEHRGHRLAGPRAQPGGLAQFFGHLCARRPLGRRRRGGRCQRESCGGRSEWCGWCGRKGWAVDPVRSGRVRRRLVGQVEPAVGVDPALAHRALEDTAEVGAVLQHKPGLPERVVQPIAFEGMQVHAQAQLGHRDFL